MRFLIISDIHGATDAFQLAIDAFQREHADYFVLCGDYLYHGPRNMLPIGYDPADLAPLLNTQKEKILAVRGNCDAEVDQLMFEFPMMGDYAVLDAGTETFFLTHGHLWNENRLPPVGMGTVLAHGHTHVPELKQLACGLTIFNPGSVSLPKGGSERSFGYFDGERLTHIRF